MSNIHPFGINPFRDGDSIVDAVTEMYKKNGTKEKCPQCGSTECSKPDCKMRKEEVSNEGLDPVGKEDSDVDNDGDSDKSDAYLKNRRKKVSAAINSKIGEEVEDLDELDNTTLQNYKTKADKEIDRRFKKSVTDDSEENKRKIANRAKGYARASTRLTDRVIGRKTFEEVDLDESDLTPPEVVKGSKRPQDKTAGEKDLIKQGSSDIHRCATKVAHEEWGVGTPVPTMHAEADENGNIEWYDVMFEHGIESKVQTEDLEILDEKKHGH